MGIENWLVVSYINWVLAVERGDADKTIRQVGPFGAKFSFPRSWSKILIFCLRHFLFIYFLVNFFYPSQFLSNLGSTKMWTVELIVY